MLLPTLSFVLSTIVFNVLVCFISLFLDGIHIGVYAAPQPRRNKQSIQSTKTTRKVYSPTGRPEFIFGSKLASKGVKSKHPVILIPGLLSSSLESWSTKSTTTASSPASDNDKKCAQKYFRKRLFAGPDFKSALFDHDCWLKHMLMDAETGLDNGDFKLRAVSGFDASDYVFPGYWIWARMISNLAAIGYDSNSMHLASYDWRLTPTNMQLRDKFFTKLKVMIESAFEIALEINGGDEDAARVLLVCHSMGSLHFYYFMQWVQSDAGGKQDQEWLDKYLYTWVNIAGPLLGAVKPISLLLSGESSTTASVSKPFGIDMLEHVFPRRERQEMFRTWGSFGNLLPKGGDAIWGSVDSPAPDAITLLKTKSDASSTALSTEASPNFGALLEIHQIASSPSNDLESTHPAARARLGVTSSELRNFFKEEHVLVQPFAKTLESQIDSHAATSDNELQENKNNQRSWSNPLLTRLPSFSNTPPSKGSRFKIVCMYGTGVPTERKFFYKDFVHTGKNGSNRFLFDAEVNAKDVGISQGALLADGDGTVPLISLGYLCNQGWTSSDRYNPSRISVITKEYHHLNISAKGVHADQTLATDDSITSVENIISDFSELMTSSVNEIKEIITEKTFSPITHWSDRFRGGMESAEHSDILGHPSVITDVLYLAAGLGDRVNQNQVFSKIKQVASGVSLNFRD